MYDRTIVVEPVYASELNKQSRNNRIVSRAVNEHQLTGLVFYLIDEIALPPRIAAPNCVL